MEFKHLKTGKIFSRKASNWFLMWPMIISIAMAIPSFGNFVKYSLQGTIFLPENIIFFIPFAIFFITMIASEIIRRKNITEFRRLEKEFHDAKSQQESILTLYKQKRILSEMHEIKEQFVLIPTSFTLPTETIKILEKKINQHRQKIRSDKENFYNIAFEVEEFKVNTPMSEKFHEIRVLFKKHTWYRIAESKKLRHSDSALVILFPTIMLMVMGIVYFFPTVGIPLLILGGIYASIIGIYAIVEIWITKEREKQLLEPLHEVSEELIFLQTKMNRYFNILQKSDNFTAESSLLFADVIELFSQKISQKQKILAKYKKIWKIIVRKFLIIQKKFPAKVEKFFQDEEEKILAEIVFLKNSITNFAELEQEKIKEISSQNSEKFWHLGLAGKRQEMLLKNLENLKK